MLVRKRDGTDRGELELSESESKRVREAKAGEFWGITGSGLNISKLQVPEGLELSII